MRENIKVFDQLFQHYQLHQFVTHINQLDLRNFQRKQHISSPQLEQNSLYSYRKIDNQLKGLDFLYSLCMFVFLKDHQRIILGNCIEHTMFDYLSNISNLILGSQEQYSYWELINQGPCQVRCTKDIQRYVQDRRLIFCNPFLF